MKSRTESSSMVVLFLALLSLACASNAAPPSAPSAARMTHYEEGVPGGSVVDTVKVSARVVAIDYKTRHATLLGPDGNEFTVKVGPAAVNFDQVQVGDQVNATVTRELVIAVLDPEASAKDVSAALVALAPKGAQPGGVMAQTTRLNGTVTGIDPVKHTATLRFADGSSETFPVRPDIELTDDRIGQRVVFQVTEMVALDVEKP